MQHSERQRAVRGESLALRYAQGDLRRNVGVNLALGFMLVLSAFLMATGAMVVERLVGSIDQLFDEAKSPHFLQMHAGEYDPAALESFARSQPGIASWTVVDLLGFDGSAVAWERASSGESGDLAESLVDNLFVSQNREFDFLLDEGGGIADPADGEVFVPVALQQRVGLERGDELAVRTDAGPVRLRVAGFVRDAQMASSLSSGTRFLVSATQHDRLAAAGGGEPEIIVEYRMHDPAGTGALQAAYERDDAVPKNGQAVTFDMIRLINAFSDGLVAVALVFASFLLILIALLNLRFVIRGTLEDQVRQIGAMKAIGLPERQIRGLYLSKYSVMALIGCVVGGLFAVGASALLTRGIAASYAAAPVTPWTFVVPVLALAVVYAVVVAVCAGVLRSVRRVEVVSALVHGTTLTPRQAARAARRNARRVRRSTLAHGGGSVLARLLRVDLRAELRQWLLVSVVFFLAAVLMILPANLLSTFSSPRFVTSMGAPVSDLRADLQFSDDVDAQRAALVEALEADERVDEVRTYANVLGTVAGEDGAESLRIEVGDYSGPTVDYVVGGAPARDEIALSVLNADRYGVSPGDPFSVTLDGTARTLTVSGVYQDVTSGGRTAKMQGSVDAGALSYVVYADLIDGQDPASVAAEYRTAYPAAGVIPVQDYVSQTLAYVTDAFRVAAIVTFVFGLGVAFLVTALFLKLQLSRDRRKTGVLSAIGFSAREIAGQVHAKTLLTAAGGVVLGTVFCATLGGPLLGALVSASGLGIAQLNVTPTVWLVLGLYPAALLAVGLAGAALLTAPLRRADKSAWLT